MDSDQRVLKPTRVWCDGFVVGALCAWTAGKKGEGPPAAVDARLAAHTA